MFQGHTLVKIDPWRQATADFETESMQHGNSCPSLSLHFELNETEFLRMGDVMTTAAPGRFYPPILALVVFIKKSRSSSLHHPGMHDSNLANWDWIVMCNPWL